jgi:hypothetical protein
MESWQTGKWLDSAQEGILEVQGILSEQLSDNPGQLQEQLAKAEVWYSRMSSLLADASARLAENEYQAILSVDGDLTAKVKELAAKAAVSRDRRLVDIINGLCKSITNRLMLGMNLRRVNAGERSDF